MSTRKREWRNYHLPAAPVNLPKKTRDGIAARNRALRELAQRLGLKFRPMNKNGVMV